MSFWRILRDFTVVSGFCFAQVQGVPSVEAKTLSNEIIQRACLVELLYYEGRNTGYEGMRSIALVVHNRTNHPKRFGRNYCETSKERKQFSFHTDKHLQKKPSERDHKAFRLACFVAQQLQNGHIPSTKQESDMLYYHVKSINPNWTKNLKVIYTDSHHKFYRETKERK